MSVSPEWERWYAAGGDIDGWYPELMRLVTALVSEADKLLELGSGSGGSIHRFRELGFPYYGIDGSTTAVGRLHERYPDLKDQIVVGDFTKDQPFGDGFDVVVDRASVAHNDSAAIKDCIDIVWRTLKPGGLFISSDWFSTWHSEFTRGRRIDPRTRTDYPDGQFDGVGKVHFSDEAEFAELFSEFEGVHLVERVTRRPAPNALVRRPIDVRNIAPDFISVDYRSAVWDFVVRKPL